jgi:hypothetical protein
LKLVTQNTREELFETLNDIAARWGACDLSAEIPEGITAS